MGAQVITSYAQHHQELRDLTLAASAPIVGMHETVESIYDEVRGKSHLDGGCGGCGGCGG
jgi:hypothetical protein